MGGDGHTVKLEVGYKQFGPPSRMESLGSYEASCLGELGRENYLI